MCPWPSHVATTSRILSMRVSRISSRCVSCVFISLGTKEKRRKNGRTKKKRRRKKKTNKTKEKQTKRKKQQVEEVEEDG